ncbi:MAG: FTR1 family protein [Pseudomonadales bacterium]|nr:FTR1 family protein [Pseudomonadales bacterium]
MLLTAIIIVLREVLEAALLASLLSSVGKCFSVNVVGFCLAILLGLFGAFLYASNLPYISELFEYTGQELLNVFLQVAIYGCLLVFVIFSGPYRPNMNSTLLPIFMLISIALAITREGSEIYIYISGFSQDSQLMFPVFVGSVIGFGIGVSIGALLYFGLIACTLRIRFIIIKIMLTVIATGFLSQAVALLLQADYLESYPALWDTSQYLSEESVVGQLLYSIMGYESTPAPQQVVVYVVAIFIGILGVVLNDRFGRYTREPEASNKVGGI